VTKKVVGNLCAFFVRRFTEISLMPGRVIAFSASSSDAGRERIDERSVPLVMKKPVSGRARPMFAPRSGEPGSEQVKIA
jgi:hypothetical protein